MNPLTAKAQLYGALGVLAMIALLGIAFYVQTVRLDAVRTEYAAFASGVEQVGKLATAAAEKQKADDKLKKEKADAENNAALAAMHANVVRLRRDRASRGFLPAPAPSSGSAETACFGRDRLEQALRRLDAGVSGLIEECSETAVNLNTAKRWAQSRPP